MSNDHWGYTEYTIIDRVEGILGQGHIASIDFSWDVMAEASGFSPYNNQQFE